MMKSLAYTVTPTLQVGGRSPLQATSVDSVDEAMPLIESGRRVLVPAAELAVEILIHLGVPEEDATWRARQRPQAKRAVLPSVDLPQLTAAPRSFDHLFPADAGPVRPVPFPRAARSQKRKPFEQAAVTQGIRSGNTQLVDPRVLLATQTGVTRPGVLFYLQDQYPTRGDTYQGDRDPGNRLPLVYIRDGRDAMILAGHHRSTAALIRGDLLEAIVVEGGWGPPRNSGGQHR